MPRLIRWNLSSRARELSGGDAIVVSIPKSGRTWVRTFLCAYFCQRYGHPFSLSPEQYGDARIPRIIYSHDRFEQRTKADRWDSLRGKYFIPGPERRRAKIVLLARDPRDTFVSHYVQLTRRTRETPDQLKQKESARSCAIAGMDRVDDRDHERLAARMVRPAELFCWSATKTCSARRTRVFVSC
jgi:Sulfotransferase domain.